MIREALSELDSKFSRRALFHTLFKGAGLVAALDHYGPSLFAATEARTRGSGSFDDASRSSLMVAVSLMRPPVSIKSGNGPMGWE